MGNLQAEMPVPTPAIHGRPGSRVLSVTGLAVASGVMLFFAAVATRSQKLLLAAVILDIPLQLGAHLFWSDDLGASGAVGGLEISVTTIVLVALYLLWFVRYVSQRTLAPPLLLRPALPLVLYLIFEVISLPAARTPSIGLYEVFVTAQMLLLYVYLTNWVRRQDDVTFVVQMLLLGLALEAGIMLASSRTGHDVQIPGLPGHTLLVEPQEGEQLSRLSGTFASPNVAGSYLSIVLTIATGLLLLTRMRVRHKALALIPVGLGVAALLLTYSREGWLALVCSILLSCVVGWRLLHLRHRLIIAGAMAVILISIVSNTSLSRRLREDDEGAAFSRIALNRLAIRMIADHPLTGVGANNFSMNLREYATREVMGEWLYTVHNKFLLIWAETGIGALLAYLWFLAASVKQGWRCWEHGHSLLAPFALVLVSGLCALIICDMFQADRGRPLMQLLVVGAALIGATHSLANTTVRRPRVGRGRAKQLSHATPAYWVAAPHRSAS